MRNILCEHCGRVSALAAGHQPENHSCAHCHRPLPRDRTVACPHCQTRNGITWDGDPAEWTCRACAFALGHRLPPPKPETGPAAVGLVGGAALGARLGGVPGALIGGLVGLLVGDELKTTPPNAHQQAQNLTGWIRAWYPYSDALTHLKLQKLAFYCHGIALAHDLAQPFSRLTFEPWEHGPVCRPIWEQFRHLGSQPLGPPHTQGPTLPPTTTQLLLDVLTVYGALDAWRLRQQTHREAPYLLAWQAKRPYIDPEETRAHFHRLYRRGAVDPPEWLFDGGSFSVDGIPLYRYASIGALADALRT